MGLVSIAQINEYLARVPNWNLEDNGKSIIRVFEFKDFLESVRFINMVSGIAEGENHHPDIRLYDYNKVEITLTTHSLGGLTEKDFAVSLEVDNLIKNAKDNQ